MKNQKNLDSDALLRDVSDAVDDAVDVDGPLSLDEVRRIVRDPNTRIVAASRDAISELKPYVDRVLAAVRDVCGFDGDAWVSDESLLSDLFDFYRDRSLDQILYDQIGERLGMSLDRAREDDRLIVRVALRLRLRESDLS